MKRFLKKRVRITLGLVVTFLITGTAVFAEDWLDGIGQAGKPLKAGNIASDSIAVKSESKGNITINFKESGKTIEIKNEELSNEVIKNINEAMTNAEKAVDWKNTVSERENYAAGMGMTATVEGNKAVDGQVIVNEEGNTITQAEDTGKVNAKGEKLFAGQAVLGHGTAVNKGDIKITKDSAYHFAQYID